MPVFSCEYLASQLAWFAWIVWVLTIVLPGGRGKCVFGQDPRSGCSGIVSGQRALRSMASAPVFLNFFLLASRFRAAGPIGPRCPEVFLPLREVTRVAETGVTNL